MTQQVSALRRSLADIEQQIARLQADRENILAKLAAVVYPVLNLPSEVTSEIFLHYLRTSPTPSPLLLSSVCSLWRRVALLTPALWSRLHFDFKKTRKTDHSLVKLWASRAGSLPLDIRSHIPPSELSGQAQVLRLLGGFSAQCQSLSLKAKGGISIPVGAFGALSCLEKLELATYNTDVFDPTTTTLPTPLDAPRLRELVLHYSLVLDGPLPWSQITTLRLHDYDSDDCMKIVQHTPNLELLEFCSLGPTRGWTTFERRVLRHLHTLILRHEEGSEIFNGLILPSLRELRCESSIAVCDNEMHQMITDSGCTLKVLALSIEDEDIVAVSSLLRLAKHIEKLEVDCRNVVEGPTVSKLLRFLSSDPKNILPSLSSLAIINYKYKIELSPLIKMLKIKREHAQLSSFKLCFDHGRRSVGDGMYTSSGGPGKDRKVDDLLVQLRDMRAAGLEVDIQSNVKWFSDEINLTMIEEIRRPL